MLDKMGSVQEAPVSPALGASTKHAFGIHLQEPSDRPYWAVIRPLIAW